MLILILWTPLGVERYHPLRWLNFGAFSFQPSETAKIGAGHSGEHTGTIGNRLYTRFAQRSDQSRVGHFIAYCVDFYATRLSNVFLPDKKNSNGTFVDIQIVRN